MSHTFSTVVRDGGEWGEFFVRESQRTTETGEVRYAATWCCVSSYGVYGHHWSHMGEPFAEFVRGIRPDYLLGKIAEQVFSEDKFKRWLRREIFTSRATREQKRAAANALRLILADNSGQAVSVMAYNDPDISHCQPEWCDCDSREWDPQAVQFANRLWPKFVEAVQVEAGKAVAP